MALNVSDDCWLGSYVEMDWDVVGLGYGNWMCNYIDHIISGRLTRIIGFSGFI